MNQFYIILIFSGIILMAFLIVWTILDKKRVFKVVRDFDKKKSELVEIINDAEQMIEELNKFSDYIVTQMDLKDEELRSNLKKADEQIRNIGKKAQDLEVHAKDLGTGNQLFNFNSDMVIDNMAFQNPAVVNMENINTVNRRPDNVIPMNSKYSEVLKLSRDGLNESEIARKLKMGKGEIQLILDINRN